MFLGGDPIANLKLVDDPDRIFLVSMKDGKIYKDIRKQSFETARSDSRRIKCPLSRSRTTQR